MIRYNTEIHKNTLITFFIFIIGQTVASQVSYQQTSLILRDYLPTLISNYLSYEFNSTVIENLSRHGCWCAKLNKENPFLEFLGGPDPIDELDEICKGWHTCRNCNDRLEGGKCRGQGVPAMKAHQYLLKYNDTDLDDIVCDNESGSDECEDSTCSIDLFYMKQIRDYLMDIDLFSFHTQIIEVVDNSTCTIAEKSQVKKYCTGDAPYLKITQTKPLPVYETHFMPPFLLNCDSTEYSRCASQYSSGSLRETKLGYKRDSPLDLRGPFRTYIKIKKKSKFFQVFSLENKIVRNGLIRQKNQFKKNYFLKILKFF